MGGEALVSALTKWIAERTHLAESRITDVTLQEDEGWAGTDVTPGDPWELTVFYHEDGKQRHIDIPTGEVGPFVQRLVELATM